MNFNHISRIKTNYPIIIIMGIMLFYLFDFGPSEIQPWDEAMYAVRSLSILNHGNWIDQTSYSPGGLYISAHPPLYIWLTAISIYFFGNNPFAIRFWSVIFAIATLFIIYKISEDKKKGLTAVLMLAFCPLYYFYSHQGQLDISFTFFIVLSAYYWLKFINDKRRKYLIYIGISFGMAMMSKIIVGMFIPISIFTYLVIQILRRKESVKKGIIDFAIIIIIGMIIFLPWHLYMFYHYGKSFIDYYFLFHISERIFNGVESNVPSLGIFYYLNALVVWSSLAFAMIFAQKIKISNYKKVYLLILFVIPLMIITMCKTKLQSYLIPVLPFLVLISADNIIEIIHKKRISIFLVLLSEAFIFWSSSQIIRNKVKYCILNLTITNEFLIYASILVVIMILTIFISSRIQRKYLYYGFILIYVSLFFINKREPYFNSHISDFSNKFKANKASLIFIDSKYSSLVANPQISYYFNSIDLDPHNKEYTFINADSVKDNPIDTIKTKTFVIISSKQIKENKYVFSIHNFLFKKKSLIYSDENYNFYILFPDKKIRKFTARE